MKPVIALLFVLGAVALAAVALWWFSRQTGARRREARLRRRDYLRCHHERDLAVQAIHEIEDKAALYRDLDSVLAAEIRAVIGNFNNDRLELNK